MTKITLDQMEFFAYHGCMKEEELTGTHFNVNLSLYTHTATA